MGKLSRRIPLLIVRIGIAVACGVASIIMATTHDSTNFFGITMDAKFQYTPSFVFFVIANAIAGAYNLLVMFVNPTSSVSGLVIITDLIMELLLTGALAAAGVVSELGKHGNRHAGWGPICNQIPKYCDHVTGAIISAFIAVLVFFVLVLFNIYKLTSLDLGLRV